MTLLDLRRYAVRQQSRIHFRLVNGMECVVDERGVARVPALRSTPDFNLEQELTTASEFSVEPVAAAAKPITRDALATMMAASAPGAAAHAEHDDD